MLASISAEEALGRVDLVLSQVGVARAAIATDGDGTLWTHDVGEALFEGLLAGDLIGEPARAALLSEAAAHGLAVGDGASAADVARELFAAYAARRYPEDRMCAAMAWCMAGMTEKALRAFSRELLEGSFRLRERLIPESNYVLRTLVARGLPVWLVSASPRAVVEEAAQIVGEEAGIPTPSVIAMTPRQVDGVIVAGTEGVWPYGEGKRLALEGVLGERVLALAMGDNVFDVSMLAHARVPLAIRPKPALVGAADRVPALLRLATD